VKDTSTKVELKTTRALTGRVRMRHYTVQAYERKFGATPDTHGLKATTCVVKGKQLYGVIVRETPDGETELMDDDVEAVEKQELIDEDADELRQGQVDAKFEHAAKGLDGTLSNAVDMAVARARMLAGDPSSSDESIDILPPLKQLSGSMPGAMPSCSSHGGGSVPGAIPTLSHGGGKSKKKAKQAGEDDLPDKGCPASGSSQQGSDCRSVDKSYAILESVKFNEHRASLKEWMKKEQQVEALALPCHTVQRKSEAEKICDGWAKKVSEYVGKCSQMDHSAKRRKDCDERSVSAIADLRKWLFAYSRLLTCFNANHANRVQMESIYASLTNSQEDLYALIPPACHCVMNTLLVLEKGKFMKWEEIKAAVNDFHHSSGLPTDELSSHMASCAELLLGKTAPRTGRNALSPEGLQHALLPVAETCAGFPSLPTEPREQLMRLTTSLKPVIGMGLEGARDVVAALNGLTTAAVPEQSILGPIVRLNNFETMRERLAKVAKNYVDECSKSAGISIVAEQMKEIVDGKAGIDGMRAMSASLEVSMRYILELPAEHSDVARLGQVIEDLVYFSSSTCQELDSCLVRSLDELKQVEPTSGFVEALVEVLRLVLNLKGPYKSSNASLQGYLSDIESRMELLSLVRKMTTSADLEEITSSNHKAEILVARSWHNPLDPEVGKAFRKWMASGPAGPKGKEQYQQEVAAVKSKLGEFVSHFTSGKEAEYDAESLKAALHKVGQMMCWSENPDADAKALQIVRSCVELLHRKREFVCINLESLTTKLWPVALAEGHKIQKDIVDSGTDVEECLKEFSGQETGSAWFKAIHYGTALLVAVNALLKKLNEEFSNVLQKAAVVCRSVDNQAVTDEQSSQAHSSHKALQGMLAKISKFRAAFNLEVEKEEEGLKQRAELRSIINIHALRTVLDGYADPKSRPKQKEANIKALSELLAQIKEHDVVIPEELMERCKSVLAEHKTAS